MLPDMARFLVDDRAVDLLVSPTLTREKRAVWDGVSNPVALKHLAAMKKGDTVVVHHTGDEKSAVGLAVAASDPYPDPKLSEPKRLVIDLAAGKAARRGRCRWRRSRPTACSGPTIWRGCRDCR